MQAIGGSCGAVYKMNVLLPDDEPLELEQMEYLLQSETGAGNGDIILMHIGEINTLKGWTELFHG
ncbi:hypothetical protein [Neobacillus soli]|uniref:hypothetical protein n=1 Tax=Neobacillus soli TaxID=220688 RepID=UPI0011552BCB|nr:hypothetical protein [Neobacillus soli]